MMKLEILEDFSGSSDQMIVKGKRTKRPRPSSSASSNGGAADFYNPFVSSPATSSGISTSREEDEDMANCLILLARGNSPPQPEEFKTSAVTAVAVENKLSSRKFAEMATTTAGKVGIYVYECKTCCRTFPSFQALGGHRASHKRPKTAAEADQRKLPPAAQPPDDREEEGEGQLRKLTAISPPAAAQSPNKPKMHECSICGSEFGSGQALGGHMRRHRPAAPPSTTSARIPTSVDNNTTSSHEAGEKARSIFALDLNLPAPPEDENLQPPPHVVFSAAALVDCHY